MSRRVPLIGVVSCLVLALAFFFLLWRPMSEEQAALESERASLDQQAQQLRLEIAQLEEIEANQVEIRAAIARLEQYIPTGVAQPALVRALQESADDAGVDIVAVTFGEPTAAVDAPATGEPGTVLGSVPLSITLEGRYFQAVDFLRRLESDVVRASLLSNLTLSEGGDGFPALAATVSGDVFAVLPAAAVVEATSPDGAEGADPAAGAGENGTADAAAPPEAEAAPTSQETP